MKILHEIKFKVTDRWLQECNDYQEMFSGIRLTPRQMLAIFKKDKCLLVDSLSRGFDTGEREEFMSLLSENLIGIDWPCVFYSKQRKYKNFFEKLTKAAKKKRYIVL